MNSVCVIGHLTRDPELRHTGGGTAVCNMRIAVNDRQKRNDEWTDVAYYFDVTVWGSQGERCSEWLSKGKKVGIRGKLTWREWEAQDGTKRQAVEIVADMYGGVDFLTPKSEGNGGGSGYSQGEFQAPAPRENDFAPAAATSTSGGDFAPSGQLGSDDDIPF